MKTSELIGPALDWAVAKCEGFNAEWDDVFEDFWLEMGLRKYTRLGNYQPSEKWEQAGPIIERECIATYASGACSVAPKNPDYWVAEILDTAEMITQFGPTPLIAAMRAYVASKLGDEVEIPSELQP